MKGYIYNTDSFEVVATISSNSNANLNKIDCYIIIRAVNNCITVCEAVE